jgi:hypothetical protein
MQAEAHPAKFTADAILDQVGALAAGQHANAEAGDFTVENDVVLLANLGRFDESFGDPGHGAGASVAVRSD